MLGCGRQKTGAGAVRSLPVSAPIAQNIIGRGYEERCDDQNEKNEHVFSQRKDSVRPEHVCN
jgi:hypothetical protein